MLKIMWTQRTIDRWAALLIMELLFVTGSFPWVSYRLPLGRFNAELLGVLGIQPLPTAELHRLATSDAADGTSAEQPIQDIESNVPPGSTHRDEAAIDLGPQR